MIPHPIDLVLFDLGGVLVDWNPDYLYAKLIPDARERELFLTEVCHPLWNLRQDAGRPWEEAIEEVVAKYPEKEPLIRAYRARWPEMLGGEISGTVALLDRLKRDGKVRLAALTNWSAETFPYAKEKFGFLDHFEDIIVSGEEKMAKPDPRIFELTIRRLGIDPGATLFVDDNERNISEARMLGFRCHHFRDPARLRKGLEENGLL